LVRLEAVSKSYGTGPNQVHVLDGVDLDLRCGETPAWSAARQRQVHPHRTDRRTHAARRRTHPDRWAPTDNLDEAERAKLRAERIGDVLQSDNLVPFLTAVENVELAINFAPGRRTMRRARELLAELGLGDRTNHLPRQLSGGEAQRVAVARRRELTTPARPHLPQTAERDRLADRTLHWVNWLSPSRRRRRNPNCCEWLGLVA
jgi:putative ABC transport system ATP-binding protein